MTQIQTERLLLRHARAGDLEAFHAILSHPLAMAYWSTKPHEELSQTWRWLVDMISIPAGEGEDFAVLQAGDVIGKVGLYRFPEVGFIFHPKVWGQGIAFEALRPVLARGFAVHGLKDITADVDPRNERSLGLLSRLGFREIGRRQNSWLVGECWCDSVDLQLTESNFLSSR